MALAAAADSFTAWNSVISRAPIAAAAALPASLTALPDVLPDLLDMPAAIAVTAAVVLVVERLVGVLRAVGR